MAFSKLFSRGRRYDDLSVSIQEHLAERADELTDEGMSRADAEQKARREFGNLALVQQHSREAWQFPTLESILADIRYAFRQLLKSPGFTVTAVATLALGIAVNATMFSLVSAFLIPHLPGRDAKSIVVISSVNPDGGMQADADPISAPNYLQWSKDTRIFSSTAAMNGYLPGSLSGPGQQPDAIYYSAVSTNYFSLIGASPQLGRTFTAGEDQPGHDHVIVLSNGLWKRRFGSDPSIVGRTVRLNREDYVVAGVMPADFRLLGFVPQLWTPLNLTPADSAPSAHNNRFLRMFARLQPGVTLEQARAHMNVLAKQAQHDFPASEARRGASVRLLGDFLIYSFGIRTALSIIMTIVAFVLLIACTNVAGLLLTRAVGRQKELALRMSLGASRVRVVRQLLTEGLVIALLGGGVGLFLTFLGIRLVRAGLSFNEAIAAIPVTLDKNVLLFAAAISVISAMLSSMAPALKASHTAISTDLKSEGRGSTAGRSNSRFRMVLVGGEIAMALFLLIGSVLLIHGVYQLDHQNLGFDHQHLLTAGLVLDKARYADTSKQKQFVTSLLEHLQQIPGVNSTAAASDLPAGGAEQVPIHIKGRPESRANERHTAADMVVTTEYFTAVGVPILRGRGFTERDDADAPRVAVVSEQFARKYFPNEEPLGKQIQIDISGAAPVWCQIAGVVADVKRFSEDPQNEPAVYEAYLQRPVNSVSVMLRSSVEPNSLASSLRGVVSQLDAELPLLRVMSMDQVIEVQRNGNPLFLYLLSIFALLALVLSAIGIYGLIAYSVGQRSQEFGIRMALGAKASDILRIVLREGIKVAGIGSAIGLALALPLPRLFDSIFQGLLFSSPAVYLIVLVVMMLVAWGATLAPAMRATRIDPTAALRSE